MTQLRSGRTATERQRARKVKAKPKSAHNIAIDGEETANVALIPEDNVNKKPLEPKGQAVDIVTTQGPSPVVATQPMSAAIEDVASTALSVDSEGDNIIEDHVADEPDSLNNHTTHKPNRATMEDASSMPEPLTVAANLGPLSSASVATPTNADESTSLPPTDGAIPTSSRERIDPQNVKCDTLEHRSSPSQEDENKAQTTATPEFTNKSDGESQRNPDHRVNRSAEKETSHHSMSLQGGDQQ